MREPVMQNILLNIFQKKFYDLEGTFSPEKGSFLGPLSWKSFSPLYGD